MNVKTFLEARVVTSVRLTTHQKRILAIMISAGDTARDEDFSGDRNLAAAREVLVKLDLIQNTKDDVYEVTETGKKVAEDEGITDGGELTKDGQKLATEDPNTPPPMGKPNNKPSDDPKDPMAPREIAAPGISDAPMEGTRQSFKNFLIG